MPDTAQRHATTIDHLTSQTAWCLSAQRQTSYRRIEKGRYISVVATESLETLMEQVAEKHDRAAFRQLFSYFAPRVKSFLLKQNVSDEVAEDLTQDVMVTVWEKSTLFDPQKARLSTWIFRIARNKFIDRIRRQKYTEVDADDHMSSMVADEETDQPVIEKQDKARIIAALTTLKPNLQDVIKLSFYEDMSHSQIAEHLSLPLGTVKSRIRIAFQKLRAVLGEE